MPTVSIPAIIEIYHYARQFMKEHGNPNQWINGYPSAELILREITNGPNYVCENENGEIIGTFCFIPGEDPTYARIDATTPETVLFQDILHHKVVVVGIYPDIVAI